MGIIKRNPVAVRGGAIAYHRLSARDEIEKVVGIFCFLLLRVLRCKMERPRAIQNLRRSLLRY